MKNYFDNNGNSVSLFSEKKVDWKTARFRLREALDDEDSNGSDDDLKQNGLDGTPVLKDASNAHQMDQVETESEDAGDSDDESTLNSDT